MITGRKTRVAILASGPSSGVAGGAERFYAGLVSGFDALDCDVELIHVRADEPTFDAILQNYQKVIALDLSRFDLVISTKTPTFAVEHHRHIVYLVHTVRAYDDMFSQVFPRPNDENMGQRAQLHAVDLKGLVGAKKIYSIGHEVANRLYRWRGLRSTVLHPPLGVGGFRSGVQGDYFFMPGRLHPWKRVGLAVDAVLRSALPLRLVIAGNGEEEDVLRSRAKGDPRIVFLGRISDAELIERYANALAVPFLPIREDFGYITLEAFASRKPVITCSDSGEPARLVRHMENGLVCKPTAAALQEALEWVYGHRPEATAMGLKGTEVIEGMSWKKVARELYDAGFSEEETTLESANAVKMRVTVLDMQPIDPPVGGGRLRLLGLYHGLGADVACTYVGSYDWPGERHRRHMLSPTLEEINVPLSDAHHKAAANLSQQAGGKTVIDLAFGRLGHLSPQYVDTAKQHMRDADVVVFSHPWVYPLVRDAIKPHQTIVYDSQNVEGFLRAQLLDRGNPIEAQLLREVVDTELSLCQRADLIVTCSHEDLRRFNRIYRIAADKMRVVPNGVMAFDHHPPSPAHRLEAKQHLGITNWPLVAFFIGSAYGPNVDAARFIAAALAPAVPDVLFVVAGGVGAQVDARRDNVHITGALGDAERKQWLAAADFAVNPMFSGSGTNIKMFDFMAMGLPVVSTDVGARGIELGGGSTEAITVVDGTVAAFKTGIERLRPEVERAGRGAQARLCVEEGYAWERISPLCGQILRNRSQLKGQPAPLFSVVIPTYERHKQLDALMNALSAQIERDFEVVVNDQSIEPWPGRDHAWGFPLTYFHSPVRGAVRARNTGAALAQGSIIAFTDDDCLPQRDWLLNARRHFANAPIVGLEGMITSDHHDDPAWRPVTNVGFEGLGFMTANLMVRNECFQLVGGFDLQFDRPHFREDTDLGWRLQEIGDVPYAHDVQVFHPAQRRDTHRESEVARAVFFQKDAILYKKHPCRYKELFLAERHFEKTFAFSENLRAGFINSEIEIPPWISWHIRG